MKWVIVGAGIEKEGPALIEMHVDSNNNIIREQLSETEAALAHVSPEARKENFIRLRVRFKHRDEPVDMRVPVGERRDEDIRNLLRDKGNIKGFIDQARMVLEQTGASTEILQ
jgi:hypothetical protein